MNSLAELAIDAHGGLDRWKRFEKVSAHLVQGGVLWPVKGQTGTLDETNVTVGLRSEWASHSPFGVPSRRFRFAHGRVAIEAADGTVLEELREPRESFAGHTLQTPWTCSWRTSLAARCGHTLTYFRLAWPGVVCEELSSWNENGESDVEIAGGRLGAHYIDAYVEVSWIKFPTVHRTFARQEDASVNREPLVVSIDISNIQSS
ncbi:hypothetical protein [Edaphobacter aggregans]|uniref:hypothetical protein n=1 Tax=Edaphobacter aggregans TaxID=570835 RepID=UPI001B806113|nr:hypothetical protein [Edaphobacter aggregans]